ncbi:MAG: dCTP deaminase [Candidatus Diapherotrites archaeon]
MLLSDGEIKELLTQGNIFVPTDSHPIDISLQLGPSSLDLRLGPEILLFDNHTVRVIDLSEQHTPRMRRIQIDIQEGFVLHPGEFVLGTTVEAVNIPTNLVGRIGGRSSLGRLGLTIQTDSGIIDPGFEGQINLQIHNVGRQPLLLRPYQRICQLSFMRMSKPAETPYSKKKDTKYHGQFGPTASRIGREQNSFLDEN